METNVKILMKIQKNNIVNKDILFTNGKKGTQIDVNVKCTLV